MTLVASRAVAMPLRISSGNSGNVAMAFNSSRLFITLLHIGLHEIATIGWDGAWRPIHDGVPKRIVDIASDGLTLDRDERRLRGTKMHGRPCSHVESPA